MRRVGRDYAGRRQRDPIPLIDPDHLRDLFARFGPISIRSMFGGQGIYADGVMIGLVAYGELYFKVDALSKPTFEAESSRPFVYEGAGKRVEMSYWRVPDSAVDDPEAIVTWARMALEAARRAKGTGRGGATKKRGRAS